MRPGQQMMILGLVALCHCAVLLATGVVGIEVLPPFVVSAGIFFSSGRLLRGVSRNRAKKEHGCEASRKEKEPDWNLRTQILNWIMAILIICALGLWVMKPVGVSFFEMFGFK